MRKPRSTAWPRRGHSLPCTRALRLAALCLLVALASAVLARSPSSANTITPGDADAFAMAQDIAVAQSLLEHSQYLAARDVFRAVLIRQPENVAALTGCAQAEYELGRLSAAQALPARAGTLGRLLPVIAQLAAHMHAEHSISVVTFHQFTWGDGIESHVTGVNPMWRANASAQYGVIAERYVLADYYGTIADDRIGVVGAFGDVDTTQLRVRVVHARFTSQTDRLDSSLDFVGTNKHFRYQAAFATTGLDGAPAAQDNLINTAGAALRISQLSGQVGWASKFTSAYIKGGLANFNDANRYHLVELGALQSLGFLPFDLEIGGYVNQSGYLQAHALASAGYFSYGHQTDRMLEGVARYAFGPHLNAGLRGAIGSRQTTLPTGTYDEQGHQRFTPELEYTNRDLRLAASGDFSQYLGGTYTPDYVSNRVELSVSTRL